jgi:hypothetical protein
LRVLSPFVQRVVIANPLQGKAIAHAHVKKRQGRRRDAGEPVRGRVSRHVTPLGALMFNAGPALGEPIGGYRGDPLYHASLSAEAYEALLDNRGINIVAHAVEDWRRAGGRTVWLTGSRV